MTPIPNTRPRVTFDAGMLIALDRDSKWHWALLNDLTRKQLLPVVPGPVVTQVWRSSRQGNVARALKCCHVEPTTLDLARAAGELCAAAGTNDAVDAIVVASAARRGDTVWTSDPGDLEHLAAHVDDVTIVPV